MNEYIYIALYIALTCVFVRELAKYNSFLCINVTDMARMLLLIFSFSKVKISIICVLCQIYTYIMLLLFVVSRFVSLDFLLQFFQDPNLLYSNLIKAQILFLFPIGFIEAGICELYFKMKK